MSLREWGEVQGSLLTHHAVALDALQVPPLVCIGGQVELADGQLELADGVVLRSKNYQSLQALQKPVR